ncbi:mannan-binding lectin serine protease 1-like [Styela clava]
MLSKYILLVVLLSFVKSGLCDPFNLHGTYGVFSSNHFPSYYDNNLNQTWTITVSKGLKVALIFTAFDIEDSYSQDTLCPFDHVQIFDGELDSNITSKRLCGNPTYYPDDAPALYSTVFTTTGNVMTLKFETDYSNNLPDISPLMGFRAVYKAEDRDECQELEVEYDESEFPEEIGKCDHHCINYMGGYTCNCKDGYELHEDGYTCVGKCSGIRLSSSSGVITSPGYPDAYPKLTDCDWTIETEVGQVIELSFDEEYDIEDYNAIVCPYDWIKVDVGSGLSNGHCGPTAPNSIVSTGNIVKIQFHSDKVTEMKGFKLTYASRGIYCDLPVEPEHGRVVETFGAENGRLPFDSVVVFECENNYEMLGVHKVTCLKDGTFDDDIPTCIPHK